MPKINRSFHLDITPEQFVNACSPMELYELHLLMSSPRYQETIRKMEEVSYKELEEGDAYDDEIAFP